MKNFLPGDPASGIASAVGRRRPSDTGPGPHVDELLQLVERINAARVERERFLDPDLFSEPGWAMLIQLFHADMVGYRLTTSNLSHASGVPLTTALRWIDALIDKGLAHRRKNPLDGRSSFIEITADARTRMYDYLCEIWASHYA